MLTFLIAFLLAMTTAAVLTPTVAWAAHRFGLLDQPDFGRKVHVRAIPRLGGVAVVLGMFAPIFALTLHENRIAAALFATERLVLAFFVGALGIFGLGLYDDLKGARARLKFIVQIAVAVVMWLAGFRIEAVGGSLDLAVDVGLLSLPLTVFWFVGVINAVNLIDGLDGLAAGIALIAATALFGVALASGQVLLALFMAALGGALVGFLFFNFNPARIFLGDSGSLFLGYVLAATSLWTHHKAAATTVITALPLFVVAVPLLDTTLCIVRRLSRGQSPFAPDREHLHHRLMALGLSHKGAVLTLYSVASIFALAGVSLPSGDVVRTTMTVGVALLSGVVLVARVGLFGDRPREALALIDLADEKARLVQQAPTIDAAWREVEEALPVLGCAEAELVVPVGGDREARVLRWRRSASTVVDTDDHAIVVRSRRQPHRLGPLTARWGQHQAAPTRAAQRRALERLHRALRAVSQRTAGTISVDSALPALGRGQILDNAE
jgi:UDP-GlcNAc:undecaprenyl-phosphate GlcNAc-1-phosphate transferase